MISYDELLEILELDEPSDFQFFENLADLIECDEEISYDAIFSLLKEVDLSLLSEIISQYFNEALEHVPGDNIDIYTLLETIGLSLAGMAKEAEEERDIVLFCEEFYRFRKWFTFEASVDIVKVSNDVSQNVKSQNVSILEALTLSRIENLSDEKYEYDFANALDYKLDEYVVKFKDIFDVEDFEEYIEKDEKEKLLEGDFLYDDEFSDEE